MLFRSFDKLVDCGALFAWFFHYMPVGNDASPELLLTPDQREKMYRAIRQYRSTKAIFTLDFQNDAEFVHGCIAGGRHYLHINANGDAEPCVFIHYSNGNIHENTILQEIIEKLQTDTVKDEKAAVIQESPTVSMIFHGLSYMDNLCMSLSRRIGNIWKNSLQ